VFRIETTRDRSGDGKIHGYLLFIYRGVIFFVVLGWGVPDFGTHIRTEKCLSNFRIVSTLGPHSALLWPSSVTVSMRFLDRCFRTSVYF
jgi:hypothetical protein